MTDLQTQLHPPAQNASQEELGALVGLHGEGRLNDAIALAMLLVQKYPFCEITHNITGAVAAAAGLAEEAVPFYDRAIALAPDYVEAYNNRGNALKDAGRIAEALASYDSAIALLPDYAEAHLNRAIVLRLEKRFEEALTAVGEAIRCNPTIPQAYTNRGNVLQDLGRFEEALADQERAIALAPGLALAHLNRGNALHHLRQLPDAVASYDRALALAPDLALAHRNRGAALKDLGDLADALASFEQALALDPADTTALSETVTLEAQICEWSHPDRRTELQHRVGEGAVMPPFHLLALADDPVLQLANALGWSDRVAARPPLAHGTLRRHGKIRIGYFSADFHSHAVMVLMVGMLENHDRARFEIHAFSFGPDKQDAMRERVVGAVDAFYDVRSLSDEAAARLAHDLGIDIAVDLSGHTAGGRPGILAWRPAPCQIGFLGYPGTTGADHLDYILADPIVAPESERGCYSETLLHLPDCYQPNDDRRAVSARPTSRADHGLPDHGFVFCCLNNTWKITPAEFDIWMRLLGEIEGSVLWLLDDNALATANLRREAAARGIDPARLVFAGRVPMDEHLARQHHADLFLDTFNYNAHTTASEALWAGLPLVTKLGRSFAARVAGSILHAAGLPELVTETEADYESLALELAREPARLRDLKAKLVASRASAPLFDTARFTRGIERIYESLAK